MKGKRFLSALLALTIMITSVFLPTINVIAESSNSTAAEITTGETGTLPETSTEVSIDKTGAIAPAIVNNKKAEIVGGTWVTIYSEATIQGTESMYVELYCGNELLATTTLVDNNKVLLNGQKTSVTYHFFLVGSDDWWKTEWVGNNPVANKVPNKVALYVDGVKTGENEVVMSNSNDNLGDANITYNFGDLDGVKVAEVNGNYYESLQAAVDAAEAEQTVTILGSFSEKEIVKVTAGKNVIIDFGGNTLYGSMLVEKGATADIKNGSIAQTDVIAGIEVQGVTTLTNMNITSARHAIRVDGLETEGTMLTVNGGTYQSNAPAGWTAHTINAGEGSTVIINGGTFIGAGAANEGGTGNCVMVKDHTTTVEIKGGTFYGSNGPEGVICVADKLTISGGSFGTWSYDNYLADGYIAVEVDNGIEGTTFKVVVDVVEGTVKNETTGKFYATLKDAIDAASEGDTILVFAESIELPVITKAGLTLKSEIGTKITNEIPNTNSDGGWRIDGTTFEGFEFTQRIGLIGKDLTINKCSFTGGNGIYYGAASGTWTITNCTFNNKTYGLGIGEGTGVVNVIGCTFYGGFNTFGTDVNFTDCIFDKGTTYSIVQTHGTMTLTDCTFTAAWPKGDDGYNFVGAASNNAVVELYGDNKYEGGSLFDLTCTERGIFVVNPEKNSDGLYTSGNFYNEPAADKLAEGFAPVQNADGSYGVISSNTIVISTVDELIAFATAVNGGSTYAGKTVVLANNIDLTGTPWAGIGVYKDSTKSFHGTFDGQGYTISGVTFADASNGVAGSEANNYRGFFNQIDNATVKNLTVSGAVWATAPASTEYGGALIVGCANDSTIENCVAIGTVNGTHNAAGVVVRVKDSNIIGCINNADITGSYSKMGGIAALVQSSVTSVLFDGCINNGKITSTARGEDGVGGIVGWIGYPNTENITVKNCVNKGEIKATSTATVGQIAAESWNGGHVFEDNKGLNNGVPATGHSAMSGLNYAVVDADGMLTYVKTLEAGNTYLVTANGVKPVIKLAIGEYITFDTSLASIDASGITVTGEGVTLEVSTNGNLVTYTAKAPIPEGNNSAYANPKHDFGSVIWGEYVGTNGVAITESFKVELYAGETLLATTVLNNVDNIFGLGLTAIAWHTLIKGTVDSYWTTTWHSAPVANVVPTHIITYVNGVNVGQDEVKFDQDGGVVVTEWAAMPGVATVVNTTTGNYYETLKAAIGAANDGDTIELLADCTVSEQIDIPAGKNITIDGKGFKLSGSASIYMFFVYGDLTIENLIMDGNNIAPLCLFINIGATVDMTECVIRNFDASQAIGTPIVFVQGTLNMTGGSIENNKVGAASNNGIVYVDAGANATTTAHFNMYSGKITGNIGGKTHQILRIHRSGYAYLNGEISGNSAQGLGGVLYHAGSGMSKITFGPDLVIKDNTMTVGGTTIPTGIYGGGFHNSSHRIDSEGKPDATGLQTIPLPGSAPLTNTSLKDEIIFCVTNNVDFITRRTLLSGTDTYQLTEADLAKVKVYYVKTGTNEYEDLADNPNYELRIIDNRIELIGLVTITFRAEGAEPATQTVKVGAGLPLNIAEMVKAPTKEGYVFKNWYLDNGGYTFGADGTFHYTSNVTLTAKWEEAPAWDGETIKTVEDLLAFAAAVNGGDNFAGKTVTLMNDIDLTGTPWAGIGIYSETTVGTAFSGTFDGQGHKISGVTFENTGSNEYRGFFNQLYKATVKNVTIETNGFGYTADQIGSMPSSMGGAVIAGHAIASTIEGCVAEGTFVGTHNVAGIVVLIQGSTIKNCTNKANLTGSYSKLGGIVNFSQHKGVDSEYKGSLIEGCVNMGTITSTARGENGVGGIIGWIGYGSYGADASAEYAVTIKGCENKGEITAAATTKVGQIVGSGESYIVDGGSNKGLTTTYGIGDNNGYFAYAVVVDGVATYVSTLEAGKTYLVTANGLKPVIELAIGEYIAFDETLASIDASGITAETVIKTETVGNITTYTAKMNPVAQIGDAQYGTLQDAINAANSGDKIVLLGNTTEAMVTVTAGKNVVIDFAGYTLNGSMFVEKGATADIKNGKIYQTASVAGIEVQGVAILTDMDITSEGRHAIRVDGLNTEGTHLTVNSGTYTTKAPLTTSAYAVNAGEKSVVIIKGGKFVGNGGEQGAFIVKSNDTLVTIEGGEFYNGDAIIMQVCNSTVITGGIYGGNGGVRPSAGYALVQDGEVYKVVVATVKNETNGTYYASLQAAVNAAAAGNTIVLLDNIHLEASLIIAAGKNVILDLAGFAITVAKISETNSLYAFENNGTLTLTDSVGTGSITARGVKNYGTFVMNGGTICTCDTNGGYGVWNYGHFTMNGGAIKTTHHVGNESWTASPTCLRNESSGTAIITGGTLESTNVAVYVIISEGTLEITPAEGKAVTVTGPRCVAIDEGTAVINGGTFTATSTGEWKDWFTLYVEEEYGAIVTINGGIFNASGLISVSLGNNIGATVISTLTINGGVFNKPVVALGVNNEDALTITGGKFLNWNPACASANPDGWGDLATPDIYHIHGYVAEGIIATQGEDGYYTLTEGKYVAKTETSCFATLAEAMDEANGSTVTLIADITITEKTYVKADLDLNGYTVTVNSTGDGLYVRSAVTIKGGKIVSVSANGQALIVSSDTVLDNMIIEGTSKDGLVRVINSACLTVNANTSINATGNTIALAFTGRGEVLINGTVTAPDGTAISTSANTSGKLDINEGAVISGTNALYVNGGDVNLNGGTYTGALSIPEGIIPNITKADAAKINAPAGYDWMNGTLIKIDLLSKLAVARYYDEVAAKYKFTILSGLDSLSYSEVGFIITIGGKTVTLNIDTVFESVNVTVNGEPTLIEASKFSSEADGFTSDYIFGVTITFELDFAQENTATFRSYAVTADGETIYGYQCSDVAIYKAV